MSSIIMAKFFCSVFVATTISVTFGRKIESHSIKARGPQRKTSTYTSNISLYKGHAFFSTRYQHLWSSHLFHKKKNALWPIFNIFKEAIDFQFGKELLIQEMSSTSWNHVEKKLWNFVNSMRKKICQIYERKNRLEYQNSKIILFEEICLECSDIMFLD